VLREYRKLGIATKLMRACHNAMKTVYKAKYCSLHVRVTNRAAITLYRDVLGYEVTSVAEEYYADKEDAFDMKLFFDDKVRSMVMKTSKGGADATEEEKKDEASTENTISTQTDAPGAAGEAQDSAAATDEAQKKKKKKNKNKKKKKNAGAADTGDGAAEDNKE